MHLSLYMCKKKKKKARPWTCCGSGICCHYRFRFMWRQCCLPQYIHLCNVLTAVSLPEPSPLQLLHACPWQGTEKSKHPSSIHAEGEGASQFIWYLFLLLTLRKGPWLVPTLSNGGAEHVLWYINTKCLWDCKEIPESTTNCFGKEGGVEGCSTLFTSKRTQERPPKNHGIWKIIMGGALPNQIKDLGAPKT